MFDPLQMALLMNDSVSIIQTNEYAQSGCPSAHLTPLVRSYPQISPRLKPYMPIVIFYAN